MHLVGVDEKLGCGVSDAEGEVVGDSFVHVESGGPAEGAGELCALEVEGQIGGVRGSGGKGCDGHGGVFGGGG